MVIYGFYKRECKNNFFQNYVSFFNMFSFFKICLTIPFNFLTSFFNFTTSMIAKKPKKPKQIKNKFSNSTNSWFLYYPIFGIRM